jgi:Zn-dependent peptidase ImmA (M78 family)/plasmid maintenance system antidote protein VapI
MERIEAINPERLVWCCRELGITPEQLAVDTGIATATILKTLGGESALTFNQISKIAKYFGRGALFFLEQTAVDEARVHSTEFRTLTNQKPDISPKVRRIIEQTERQRDVFINLRDNYVEDEDVAAFNPPVLQGLGISEAARRARTWLGLANQNTFEGFRSKVEEKGILVFRSNGYNGKWQIPQESPILGFSLFDLRCPVIVVKKQRWPARQTFTLMHELGHLLLHRTSSIDDEADLASHQGREREANAFAGNVLVPNEYLRLIQDGDRPADVAMFDEWLAVPRRAWGVSGEVILRRLHDSGRLPVGVYAAYRQWTQQQDSLFQDDDGGGNRQYRHREPKHIFGDVFVRTVLGAMNARQITLTKASSYLDGLKIKDLHQLDRHYAGI